MIKAAAYCRVSTDTEDQLNSLTAQEEFFRGYCVQQGYELTKIYSDEGLSGTKKAKRKAFQQMLSDAQDKKFDYLLVKDISRLARNIIDSIETIRFLKRNILKVIFINQPNLTDDEFVLGIMGLIAQQESENLSKRVKFGKKMNMKKGKVPNLVYGYDKVAGDYYNLLINEKEAQVVQRIFHYYTKDGFGCAAIANLLNEEGILTKQGARWQQITVARILKNELYIGHIINGKQEMLELYSFDRKEIPKEQWYIVEKPELKIIDPDIFEEARSILSGRQDAFIHQNTRNSNKHVFSTLIKCSTCQSSYRRLQVRNKSNTVSWGCNNRSYYGVGACSNSRTVKEDELLNAIKNYLCDLYRNRSEMRKRTMDEFKRLYAQTFLSKRSRISLERELKELRSRYERQITMCEKGFISFEEFEKRSKEVKDQIERLEGEIICIDNTVVMENTMNTLLEDLFRDIDQTLSSEVFTNQMLKKIINYIEVFPDGKIIIYMKILNNFQGSLNKSAPKCNTGT